MSICNCLDATHSPASPVLTYLLRHLWSKQAAVCMCRGGLEVGGGHPWRLQRKWRTEVKGAETAEERAQRYEDKLGVGGGMHGWNSRIRFLSHCSEMHYDEFWPNYRGAGFGGRGVSGREVWSHTGKGWKWVNVKVWVQAVCHLSKQINKQLLYTKTL